MLNLKLKSLILSLSLSLILNSSSSSAWLMNHAELSQTKPSQAQTFRLLDELDLKNHFQAWFEFELEPSLNIIHSLSSQRIHVIKIHVNKEFEL